MNCFINESTTIYECVSTFATEAINNIVRFELSTQIEFALAVFVYQNVCQA